MTDTPRIRAARREVEERKTILIDTVRELQQRLQPRTLASDAWEAAKNKGADLAEEAVDAVTAAPSPPAGSSPRWRCSWRATRSRMPPGAFTTA